MHLRADLDAAAVPPEALYAWVDDLARYPAWLGIVRSAAPVPAPDPAPAAESPPPPAWDVVLAGRLGPLRRLKRLRMERTSATPPLTVRFERRELDGRPHARWELSVEVVGTPDGSRLVMDLDYSGSLLGPPLQRLLRAEIEAAKPRLVTLAREGVPS